MARFPPVNILSIVNVGQSELPQLNLPAGVEVLWVPCVERSADREEEEIIAFTPDLDERVARDATQRVLAACPHTINVGLMLFNTAG